MKRIVNGLRKIFETTIRPLQRKKEDFYGKMRFSLRFRITFNYARLFLINTAIIMLMFMMIFIYIADKSNPEAEDYSLVELVRNSRELEALKEALIWILPVIILVTVFMLFTGRRQLKTILKPIEEMSRAAERLNAGNLNSERLNVEGTKNELKDLAATFNSMLDRLELSYESQKQFVSDASHELRTPIAVVQGYINMLDRWGKSDPEVLEEGLEAIRLESLAMQELVEKLLFLSRHDKKTLKLKREFVNAGEIVSEMVRETRMVAEDRTVESDEIENVTIFADKQSIKQAIRVFTSNAAKYTQSGGHVRLGCRREGKYCAIRIRDDGIGMKKKDVDNIFGRFYRADDVRGRNIAGHGLGLSIALLIIQKHAGSIKVRSKFGEGTEFTILIPAAAGAGLEKKRREDSLRNEDM